MEYPIIVRLEVDHMKQQILHSFTDRQLELSKMLSKELDNAISAFDFQAEVKRQVAAQMPHLVESAIKRAILEVLSTDDVRNALEALAHDAVYAYIARKQ